MSKIGQYALEIQEQANELGFSTIQEAFDNGYEVVGDVLIQKVDSRDALAEMEKAHEEWLKEKESVLTELNKIKFVGPSWQEDIVKQAIKFVEDCNDR